MNETLYKELAKELAWHEEAADNIERRTGQTNTYHHDRAAQIRAELKQLNEVSNDKLD